MRFIYNFLGTMLRLLCISLTMMLLIVYLAHNRLNRPKYESGPCITSPQYF